MSIKAIGSTMGQAKVGAEPNYYVYGGDKPLEAEDERKHPGPPPGSPKSTSARAARMAVFAAARAEGKNLTEAAAAAGVTLPTARAYKRALEQEGGSDG